MGVGGTSRPWTFLPKNGSASKGCTDKWLEHNFSRIIHMTPSFSKKRLQFLYKSGGSVYWKNESYSHEKQLLFRIRFMSCFNIFQRSTRYSQRTRPFTKYMLPCICNYKFFYDYRTPAFFQEMESPCITEKLCLHFLENRWIRMIMKKYFLTVTSRSMV